MDGEGFDLRGGGLLVKWGGSEGRRGGGEYVFESVGFRRAGLGWGGIGPGMEEGRRSAPGRVRSWVTGGGLGEGGEGKVR